MPKCDFEIERTQNIKVADFNNIKPSIKLSFKDIPIEHMEIVYKKASKVLDGMMANEILSMGEEASTIDKIGFKKYFEKLKENKDKISTFLEKAYSDLIKEGYLNE